MAEEVVAKPDATFYNDTLSLLQFTVHPQALSMMFGQLREPTNSSSLRACLIVLTTLVKGARLDRDLRLEAARLAVRHLRDPAQPYRVHRGAANLIRALGPAGTSRLATVLTAEDRRVAASIIRDGRAVSAQAIREAQQRVRAALDLGEGHTLAREPVLSQLISTALGETNEEDRSNALAILMISPQSRVIGRVHVAALVESLRAARHGRRAREPRRADVDGAGRRPRPLRAARARRPRPPPTSRRRRPTSSATPRAPVTAARRARGGLRRAHPRGRAGRGRSRRDERRRHAGPPPRPLLRARHARPLRPAAATLRDALPDPPGRGRRADDLASGILQWWLDLPRSPRGPCAAACRRARAAPGAAGSGRRSSPGARDHYVGGVDTDAVLALLQDVAAEVINPRFRALAAGEIHEKKPGDLVTDADREAEVLITAALVARLPRLRRARRGGALGRPGAHGAVCRRRPRLHRRPRRRHEELRPRLQGPRRHGERDPRRRGRAGVDLAAAARPRLRRRARRRHVAALGDGVARLEVDAPGRDGRPARPHVAPGVDRRSPSRGSRRWR